MKYENELSSSLPMDYGVPQGFVAWTLTLYFVHKRSTSCIRNSYINMYADDAVIYSTGADIMNNVETLQNDLTMLFDGC